MKVSLGSDLLPFLLACIFCFLSLLNTFEVSLNFCNFCFFKCSVVRSILGVACSLFFALHQIPCLSPKCLPKVPLFLTSLPLVQNLAAVDALSSCSTPPRSWWWYLPWNFHWSLLNPWEEGRWIHRHSPLFLLCQRGTRNPPHAFLCWGFQSAFSAPGSEFSRHHSCLIRLHISSLFSGTEGFHLELAQDSQIPVIW